MAKLFWWKARKGYYARLDGSKSTAVRFGSTKQEAELAFAAAAKQHELRSAMPGSTVYWLDQFLQAKDKEDIKPKTKKFFRYLLNSLMLFDEVIDQEVADFNADNVKHWLASKGKTWKGTKRSAVTAVRCFCKWLSENPRNIKPIDWKKELPLPAEKRKAKVNWVCDRTTQDKILGFVNDQQFRDAVEFMYYVGCRPYEMAMIEKRHLDIDASGRIRVVLPSDEVPEKKTLHKGQDRVLYPEPEGQEILRRLAEGKGKNDVLFLNSDGRPWTIWALNCRSQKLKKDDKVGIRYSPYAWRHGFITRYRQQGMDLGTLSELVAASEATIRKFYDHHTTKPTTLWNAVTAKTSV